MNYATPPTHIRANRIGEETLSRRPVSESCRPRASSPGPSRLGYVARLAALHDRAPNLNALLFLGLSASRCPVALAGASGKAVWFTLSFAVASLWFWRKPLGQDSNQRCVFGCIMGC